MSEKNLTPRARVLTDEDIKAIAATMQCKASGCQFSQEEVIFVRDWLDTAKTARSEVVKWIIKGLIWTIGILAGLQVAFKMGWFKFGGK